ncbi:hypothetical protein QE152_g8007 [Popillia japonica]|uniref:Uncharacterized protein n=1 Tax=Popillia japonica TaxID=7064 RepID=A0AAW1MEE3_POPJA
MTQAEQYNLGLNFDQMNVKKKALAKMMLEAEQYNLGLNFDQMNVKKKALAKMMLVEMHDIEDEMDLVVAYSLSTRGECKDMYKERENEGARRM